MCQRTSTMGTLHRRIATKRDWIRFFFLPPTLRVLLFCHQHSAINVADVSRSAAPMRNRTRHQIWSKRERGRERIKALTTISIISVYSFTQWFHSLDNGCCQFPRDILANEGSPVLHQIIHNVNNYMTSTPGWTHPLSACHPASYTIYMTDI